LGFRVYSRNRGTEPPGTTRRIAPSCSNVPVVVSQLVMKYQ
jgi:hypothetical protein